MRNSDKCIIKAIGSFVLAAGLLVLLYIIDTEHFYASIFPCFWFLIAGYFYGMSRGWHDIELRRTNPEYFKDEKLEDE
ncbi:MAG: hypothetical protein OEZ15_11475 [Gammaproteobacteria bacterium]|nr:hypothetical protein [Gammaproteobacteria bacterium]